MSVTVMNKSGIEGSGYVHGMSCISMIESTEKCNGDRRFSVEEKVVAKEKRQEKKLNITCSSSSTSSIGKNSDLSSKSVEENSGDTEEVQSSYKGGPLEAMEALEEVLPIRRGISRFYNGKSKSFASLGDASSSSSMKDIAKPENAFVRRRRNLLACSLAWDKNRSSPLKGNGGGVSKRVNTNSSRVTLALAVSMSNSSNDNNLTPGITSIAGSPLLRSCLSPQVKDYSLNGPSLSISPRHDFSALRSFSLADLQHCVSITASCKASTDLDIKPSHT